MLRVHLFGPPRLQLDDAPLPVWGRPKVLPLLAFLVLRARSAVSREVVARTLWPDDDDSAARANLRRHLHYLGELLPVPEARPWFAATASTVAWAHDNGAWCDVIEFESCERSPNGFAEAVALYSGDLLEGCDEEWIEFERESYRVAFLSVLERLALAQLARRNYGDAERHAQLLLLHDPWRETAVRALMRIRFEAGDRAGALAAYERFGERLRDELGTVPMPDTEAAYQALRSGRAPPGTIAGAGDGSRAATPSAAADLPFVGRERELEKLDELARAAASGCGAMVTISGEAGIGKSRLVREAAIGFEAAGGGVFAGAASSPESTSYQPIVEVLRAAAPLAPHLDVSKAWLGALTSLAPELAAHVDAEPPRVEPGRERTRLFEACAVFLGALAVRRPLLLVFEDLHWASGATIALVEYLARRLQRERALLLVTYREEELPRNHPLRELRRRAEREGIVAHVPLGSLSYDNVAALVRGLDEASDEGAVAARLHRQSDGNPFFLGELLRSARELGELETIDGVWRWRGDETPAPPRRLQETLEGRIRRLGDGAQELAAIAAVIGAAFDVELLAETTGWPEADLFASLDELIDRRLVLARTVGSRFCYAFAHQLVAATIYGGLGTTRLRAQHRRVATVLEDLTMHGRDKATSEIARHWDRAGEFERAAAAYVRAASGAFAVAAYEDGQRLVTRALELSAMPSVRCEALLTSEGAASVCADRALQAARLDELERLAGALEDDATTLEVRSRRLALVHLRNDRENEARLIAELALAAARNGSPAWEAVALEAEIRMCRTSGDYERARVAFDRLARVAERCGDRNRYVAAYIARADVDIYQGRFDDARRSLDSLRAIVAEGPDRPMLVRALMTFARSALARQAYDEMTEYAREAYRISSEIGDREGEALALHTIANGLVYPFRVAEARATYARARELYDAIEHHVGQASLAVDEGLFHTEIGLLDRAFEHYERADAIAATIAFAWVRCVVRINKAYALRLSGDHASSAATAADALALARDLGSEQLEAAALGTLGAAESELGTFERALKHLRRGVELRRGAAKTPRLGDNLCALALALLRAGNGSAAARVSAELVALHTAHPHLAPQPTEWLGVAARIAAANGDDGRAVALRAAAAAAFHERLARIDDDATRSAFAALPFNRAVAEAPGVC